MIGRMMLTVVGMLSGVTMAYAAGPSVEYGKTVSIIGGCHDCHTADYGQKNGVINPDTALKGNPVGFQGPWGTTYAPNLRLVAAKMSEDDWVKHLQTFTARPPMPAAPPPACPSATSLASRSSASRNSVRACASFW